MGRSLRLNLRPSFGVHWADGVAFLVQSGGVTNALDLDLPTPFAPHPLRECPHKIDLKEANELALSVNDPLLSAMSCVPGPGVYAIRHDVEFVRGLQPLCSPLGDFVEPLWVIDRPRVEAALTLTNCLPLVVSDVSARDTAALLNIARRARGAARRVLFVTQEWLPALDGVVRIETALTSLPPADALRAHGAAMLKAYMLNGGRLPTP